MQHIPVLHSAPTDSFPTLIVLSALVAAIQSSHFRTARSDRFGSVVSACAADYSLHLLIVSVSFRMTTPAPYHGRYLGSAPLMRFAHVTIRLGGRLSVRALFLRVVGGCSLVVSGHCAFLSQLCSFVIAERHTVPRSPASPLMRGNEDGGASAGSPLIECTRTDPTDVRGGDRWCTRRFGRGACTRFRVR